MTPFRTFGFFCACLLLGLCPQSAGAQQETLRLNCVDTLVSDFPVDAGMETYAHDLHVFWVANHPYALHPTKRHFLPFHSEIPNLPQPTRDFSRPEAMRMGGKTISSPVVQQSREINAVTVWENNLYVFARRPYVFDAEGNELGVGPPISPAYIDQKGGFPYPENQTGTCQADFERGILLSPARNYEAEQKALRGKKLKKPEEKELYHLWEWKNTGSKFERGPKIATLTGIPANFGNRELHFSESFACLDTNRQEILLSFAGTTDIYVYDYNGNLSKTLHPAPVSELKRQPLAPGQWVFLPQLNQQAHLGRLFPDPDRPKVLYRVLREGWSEGALDKLYQAHSFDYDPQRWKPSVLLAIDRDTGRTQRYALPEGHYIVAHRPEGLYTRQRGDWERPVLYRFEWPSPN